MSVQDKIYEARMARFEIERDEARQQLAAAEAKLAAVVLALEPFARLGKALDDHPNTDELLPDDRIWMRFNEVNITRGMLRAPYKTLAQIGALAEEKALIHNGSK